MVCSMIMISENVTLPSMEMIHGTIVISKSVRDSYFFAKLSVILAQSEQMSEYY